MPEEVKEERHARLMQHQQAISAELLAARIGKTIKVIVDEVDEEGAIARSTWDAPEIDGNVYLNGETALGVGDRLRVVVEAADEYDLWGSVTSAPQAQDAKQLAGAYAGHSSAGELAPHSW
jgi:ribosomal protein S12 methylthiotransferase